MTGGVALLATASNGLLGLVAGGEVTGTIARAAATAANQGEATLGLIRIFVLLVGAAALVMIVARRVNLPYTVALVTFGLVAGSLARPLAVQITPQLVLVVLLPPLIFEAAYRTDFAKLRPSLGGVALLAGPGVLISAVVTALFLELGSGLPVEEALVVGAMLAATDPAAVLATFKRLDSPRRLATLVEAESLFNDGTGIVVFTLAVSYVSQPVSPLDVGIGFVAVVLISAAMGAIAGFLASRVLPFVGDHLIELSLSVVLAYGTYLAADAIHQSGVIAAAVAGLMLGNYGRRRGFSEMTEDALDTVWEFLAFLATAFVFLLIGFAITPAGLLDVAGPIGLAVVGAFVGRAIIVYGLLGTSQLIRRRLARRPVAVGGAIEAGRLLPLRWHHVIFWAGLRGAVSTALALSLPADFPDRAELQGITFGVVLFTLFVQATSAEPVVARWGRGSVRPSGPDDAGESGRPAGSGRSGPRAREQLAGKAAVRFAGPESRREAADRVVSGGLRQAPDDGGGEAP